MSRKLNVILWLILSLGQPSIAQQSTIAITSPAEGTLAAPGDNVTVRLNVDPSITVVSVAAESPISFAQSTGDPTVFTIAIPNSLALRKYHITAIGKDSTGAIVKSAFVTIDVERPDVPLSLEVTPDLLDFSTIGEKVSLLVFGKFKDNAHMDMTESTRITYSSTDTTIVTVTSIGLTTAVAPGNAYIVIKGVSALGALGQDVYQRVAVTVPHKLALSGISDLTTEATASLTPVSFSVTGLDPADVVLPAACIPVSGSTFALGTTGVACSATDAVGDTVNGSFNVTVQDTTPPALNIPQDLLAVASDTPVAVNYTATAADLVDGSVPVTCTPPSGSTFPLGDTNVFCSATDAHNNTAPGSFNVAVSSPTQTVTFDPIPNHLTTDDPFALSASASSELPVTFSIVSGPATVSGFAVTLTGTTGTVVAKASQAGGGGFNAASATRSFYVAVPFAQATS